MKKIILLAVIICCSSFLKAQDNTKQILELTKDELAKIGVFVGHNKIRCYYVTPDSIKFDLVLKNNCYAPFGVNIKYKTNFDFYPYYISNLDSACGFHSVDDERENILKMEPLFEKEMMLNHLVPVRVKENYKPNSKRSEYLFWFEPTESFCKLIPERYKINIKYINDTLITSKLALGFWDGYLKKIGFEIDSNNILIETLHYNPKDSVYFLIKWYNDKSDCGVMRSSSGSLEKILSDTVKKNNGFNITKTDYYIVRVEDINGKLNYSSNYDGLVIPFYIKNKGRNLNEKEDVIIYLNATPSLIKKIDDMYNISWKHNKNRYLIDYKTLPKK